MSDLEALLRKIVREEVRGALDERPDSAPTQEGEFENTEQVSKRIGVSEALLLQMRRRGQGPPFVKVRRRILYRTADVNDWLAKQARTPEAR